MLSNWFNILTPPLWIILTIICSTLLCRLRPLALSSGEIGGYPHFYRKKQRLGEIKKAGPGHTVNKQQGQDKNPCRSDSRIQGLCEDLLTFTEISTSGLERINHRYMNWHTKSAAGLSRAFSSTPRFIPTKLELPTSRPYLNCLPDSNPMTMDGWLSHPAALLPKVLMPGTFSLWKLSWAAFHRKGNGPTS